MSGADPRIEPTRVRDQPALRRPRAVAWLAPSGVLAALAIALFALNIPTSPALARRGLQIEGALWVAMIVVVLARPPRRRFGVWLAVLMSAMAMVALVLLGVMAALAWAPAG